MKLSIDELVKIAENAKSKNERVRGETTLHKSVDRFIKEFNVTSGITYVPNYVIFYTYRVRWQGMVADQKTNKIVFFRTFNKRFKQKRIGKQRRYLLDGSVFDLTREGLEEAKHYDRTQKAYKKTQKATRERKKTESQKRIQSEV